MRSAAAASGHLSWAVNIVLQRQQRLPIRCIEAGRGRQSAPISLALCLPGPVQPCNLALEPCNLALEPCNLAVCLAEPEVGTGVSTSSSNVAENKKPFETYSSHPGLPIPFRPTLHASQTTPVDVTPTRLCPFLHLGGPFDLVQPPRGTRYSGPCPPV